MRTGNISRKTNETDINLTVNLDGSGKSDIATGCGFLDHMLTLFSRHGRFDLTVKCVGDTYVDYHHTVEDIGISLGKAFCQALGDKRGIVRYGDTVLPMDESLILSAVDISGRGGLYFALDIPTQKVGDFEIRFIRSDHGEGAPLEVGVIVTVDGKNILEVGDTSLHLDWKEEYLSAGQLDVLIAPINGAYGNLNEQEQVDLTKLLQPKLTVPCHFGMFASHGGNPGLWRELILQQIPTQKYKILTMGESIQL